MDQYLKNDNDTSKQKFLIQKKGEDEEYQKYLSCDIDDSFTENNNDENNLEKYNENNFIMKEEDQNNEEFENNNINLNNNINNKQEENPYVNEQINYEDHYINDGKIRNHVKLQK
jgi:hypothetical protein